MQYLKKLYQAIAGNGHNHAAPLLIIKLKSETAGPPPQDFGEVIGYLAWYLKQIPETQDSHSNHLKLSLDYLMAWLRNELVDDRLPSNVSGEGWSL